MYLFRWSYLLLSITEIFLSTIRASSMPMCQSVQKCSKFYIECEQIYIHEMHDYSIGLRKKFDNNCCSDIIKWHPWFCAAYCRTDQVNLCDINYKFNSFTDSIYEYNWFTVHCAGCITLTGIGCYSSSSYAKEFVNRGNTDFRPQHFVNWISFASIDFINELKMPEEELQATTKH